MNFALIIDGIGTNDMNSFYIENDQAYSFKDDKPYNPSHMLGSVGSKCFISTFNYPWLFENGYFLNWSEFKHDLPDLDLDLIFVVRERSLARTDGYWDDWCEVDKLRSKYPKSKIVGFLKEIWVGPPFDYNHPKHLARIEFLKQCDTVLMNRPEDKIGVFEKLRDEVKKPFNFVAQPHNIDYFYDNFGNEKYQTIWAYLPQHPPRRANTYEFANYIGNKFNIPVRYKQLQSEQQFHSMGLEEFIRNWSTCMYHFNLDPIDYFPGKQVVHTASVGTINIGGVNDNHFLLYPQTATNDVEILEQRFTEYYEDDDKRNSAVQYAWDKVNEIFSFDAVKKQIKNMEY